MENIEIFNKKLYILYISLGVFFFILFLAYIWNLTVDDAYISFRYALHLAEGYGLVWNVGEPPVEGYSNFLWVILISIFIYLKLDPVIVSKIIGLFSVSGILFYFWKFTGDIFRKMKNVALLGFSIALLFFLANPATAMHVVAGLETMLYSFFIVALSYYAYKIIISPEKRYYWLFGLFALLLSLLRFEGILITFSLIFLMIILAYRRSGSIKLDKDFILPVICLFVIPIVVYMIFRLQYFHEIVPLTYYAKTGNVLNKIIYNIYEIYNSYLMHLLPFIFTCLLVIIDYKLFLSDKSIREKYFDTFIILLFVAVAANIVYLTTSLAMNYGDRLFYPSYLLMYLLTGISLALIFTNKDIYTLNVFRKNKYSRTILQVVVVLLILAANTSFIYDFTWWHEYENLEYNTQVQVGMALQPFAAYNYTVASDFAGALPYYSGWRHIDMLGLNDKFIAKNKEATLDYVQQVKPDLIIMPWYSYGNFINDESNPFYVYAKENNYTEIKYSWGNFTYYLNPKIEHYEEIKQVLSDLTYENVMSEI